MSVYLEVFKLHNFHGGFCLNCVDKARDKEPKTKYKQIFGLHQGNLTIGYNKISV